MSDEEMCVEIAEACGWKSRTSNNPDFVQVWKRGEDYCYALPDYLNDLNAMCEACRYAKQHLMDADQWHEFGRLLEAAHPTAVLLDSGRIDYWDLATLIADLTARQIAEAFLKALGKCKEEA